MIFLKYKIKVETKTHLCFLKKGRGALWVCYGTKGAVEDRKSLGTTITDRCWLLFN
jgi:hypothetical protein